MPNDDPGAGAAPTLEVARVPEPCRTDSIVDAWFGDYGIPNHYQSAKDELKRRLKEEN